MNDWIGRKTADYEIREHIETDGRTLFFRAVDARRGGQVRLVALDVDVDPIELEMFRGDGSPPVDLGHPHVLPEETGALDGRPYLVRPDRPSLRDRLEGGDAPKDEEILSIVSGLASVLDHAASRGVAHGGIRPEAIVLDANGQPQLGEFGFSRLHRQLGLSATGSLRYQSPEALTGGPIGPTADLYSLGVILAELLLGRPLFDGDAGQLLEQQRRPLARIDELQRAALNPALLGILERALAFESVRRYPTGAALVGDLERALGDMSRSTETLALPPRPAPGPRTLRWVALLLVATLVPLAAWWLDPRGSGAASQSGLPVATLLTRDPDLYPGDEITVEIAFEPEVRSSFVLRIDVDGNAVPGTDYELLNLEDGCLRVEVGEERVGFTVRDLRGPGSERARRLALSLDGPEGIECEGRAAIDLLPDPEPAPLPPVVVEFEQDEHVLERGGRLRLGVRSSTRAGRALRLEVMQGGNAVEGADYELERRTVELPEGEQRLDLVLTALDTAPERRDVELRLSLLGGEGAEIGDRSTTAVRIVSALAPELPLDLPTPRWPRDVAILVRFQAGLRRSLEREQLAEVETSLATLGNRLHEALRDQDWIDEVSVRGLDGGVDDDRSDVDLVVEISGQPSGKTLVPGNGFEQDRYLREYTMGGRFLRADRSPLSFAAVGVGVSTTPRSTPMAAVPEALDSAATDLLPELLRGVEEFRAELARRGTQRQVALLLEPGFAALASYFARLLETAPGVLDGSFVGLQRESVQELLPADFDADSGWLLEPFSLSYRGSRHDLDSSLRFGLELYLQAVHPGEDVLVERNTGSSLSLFRIRRPNTPVNALPQGEPDPRWSDVVAGLRGSVYLVTAERSNGDRFGLGTAWRVGTDLLATNAHVARYAPGLPGAAELGTERLLLYRTDERGQRIEIALLPEVAIHPLFGASLALDAEVRPLDGSGNRLLPMNSADLALLRVDPRDADRLDGPVLELASNEALRELDAGEELALLGYPLESLDGLLDDSRPPLLLQTGRLVAATDFYRGAAPAEQRLLLHHSCATAGGASGSPVLNEDGQVVGIHFAGAYAGTDGDGRRLKVAGFNYAQRADLLRMMLEGDIEAQPRAAEQQWLSLALDRRREHASTLARRARSTLNLGDGAALEYVDEGWSLGEVAVGLNLLTDAGESVPVDPPGTGDPTAVTVPGGGDFVVVVEPEQPASSLHSGELSAGSTRLPIELGAGDERQWCQRLSGASADLRIVLRGLLVERVPGPVSPQMLQSAEELRRGLPPLYYQVSLFRIR